MTSSIKLVQYVVVRRDLLDLMKWPVGAVIAQACHACTAVIHQNYDDEFTQKYLKDVDHMHKVVLEAKDQKTVEDISKILTENEIKHKLWTEQPENYPTCLALKPYPKEEVHKFLKKLKLFK